VKPVISICTSFVVYLIGGSHHISTFHALFDERTITWPIRSEVCRVCVVALKAAKRFKRASIAGIPESVRWTKFVLHMVILKTPRARSLPKR